MNKRKKIRYYVGQQFRSRSSDELYVVQLITDEGRVKLNTYIPLGHNEINEGFYEVPHEAESIEAQITNIRQVNDLFEHTFCTSVRLPYIVNKNSKLKLKISIEELLDD